MHRAHTLSILTLAITVGATPALAQDASRAAEGGGVHVDGWTGRIDAREAEGGATLADARLSMDGEALHVVTGPAVAYWNPGNVATGEYTVSATFAEPEFMNLNNHPHPYGVFIGGQALGTDQQRYLYCAAYGTGRFIVRGFGPAPFQVNGRRPEEHEAVNQAAGQGEPVTQEIALTVTAETVSCSINGTVVGTYPRSAVVGEGMLSTTDGVYGIRSGHNTEVRVSGLTRR